MRFKPLSCFGGHFEVALLLLENGANVNAQGGKYGTALEAARRGGSPEIVHLLMENGADVKTDLQAVGAEENYLEQLP